MDHDHVEAELETVLLSEEQILTRVDELAARIAREVPDGDLLVVGVLGGAAVAAVDLVRAMNRHVELGWMALRSYGSGVQSSGTVSLLKDLDVDVSGRHVLVVDGVIDTGLTAKWVTSHLRSRGAASVRFCAVFRKPQAPRDEDVAHYIGFDLGEGMIVGYGLDYAGRYRNLRSCAVLAPHVYAGADTTQPAAA